MKAGLLSLVICTSFGYFSCWYCDYNFMDGMYYVSLLHLVATATLLPFLLEYSYMCKFTRNIYCDQNFMLLTGVLAGCGRAVYTNNIAEMYHGAYLYFIGMFVIDSYFLFGNPTQVFFLRGLVGKYVICRIGLEVRQGYLKSLLSGDKMNLELIKSQRVLNGKARKRLKTIKL
ncbi:hypothetical protein GCK72_013271 [Caenorhabditis remanei]|uniref:Uncharacterized protein n=1 Tax=Caenorhabditis remanei TaxID=31234 RepID=A0A6A5GNK1_CAERE|nr:hypothetical protein GCK72_013271 [Caenorhabditis remanei]KAF1756817.1 hypothetical protein GCK72_013271 [Caenorhabditis remanei]